MTAVLRTVGLRKNYGGFAAVDGVDIAVEEGSFHAIIGPNGAGKTTLFHLLSGHVRASAGQILLRGQDITALGAHQRARLGLGRSFQITNVFSGLTVAENLRIAAQAASWQRLRPTEGAAAIAKRVADVAAELGLTAVLDLPGHALAHGDQRKLELALLVAAQPSVLLLDEPTAGLALEEVPAMVGVIRRLRAGGRRTIVLVEHKMEFVLAAADRVTVLVAGQVAAEGRPEEIRSNPEVLRAYLGEEVLA